MCIDLDGRDVMLCLVRARLFVCLLVGCPCPCYVVCVCVPVFRSQRFVCIDEFGARHGAHLDLRHIHGGTLAAPPA